MPVVTVWGPEGFVVPHISQVARFAPSGLVPGLVPAEAWLTGYLVSPNRGKVLGAALLGRGTSPTEARMPQNGGNPQ